MGFLSWVINTGLFKTNHQIRFALLSNITSIFLILSSNSILNDHSCLQQQQHLEVQVQLSNHLQHWTPMVKLGIFTEQRTVIPSVSSLPLGRKQSSATDEGTICSKFTSLFRGPSANRKESQIPSRNTGRPFAVTWGILKSLRVSNNTSLLSPLGGRMSLSQASPKTTDYVSLHIPLITVSFPSPPAVSASCSSQTGFNKSSSHCMMENQKRGPVSILAVTLP